MADDNNQSSAFGRFQSRRAGGEQASAEKPKRATEPPIFNPKDLTQVAGIVGRLKDWIGGACLHPNPRFDVGAALAILGTLMSQRVAAPEHGSTHLYAVAIGGSASGKQLRLDAVKEALTAIGASDRLGPDDFRSSVGVINELKRHSCFCAPVDEYATCLLGCRSRRSVLPALSRSAATHPQSTCSTCSGHERGLWKAERSCIKGYSSTVPTRRTSPGCVRKSKASCRWTVAGSAGAISIANAGTCSTIRVNSIARLAFSSKPKSYAWII